MSALASSRIVLNIQNNETKKIECNIKEPWLGWIIEGKKKWEGRLNREKWSRLKVGDVLHAKSDKNDSDLIVKELKYYKSFGEAWNEMKEGLVVDTEYAWDAENAYCVTDYDNNIIISDIKTDNLIGSVKIGKEEIDLLYKYMMKYSDEELKKYGVVMIGI